MDNFIDKWDFVDVDGGVWKQGWPITTSDAEWKETKLKVILMPHSHNDPGWVKTIDVYYQGQTRTILNTIVDALSGHPARKFIWAEVVFLHMWFTDPQVWVQN
jgi:alpha-mannosidase II